MVLLPTLEEHLCAGQIPAFPSSFCCTQCNSNQQNISDFGWISIFRLFTAEILFLPSEVVESSTSHPSLHFRVAL